MHIFLRQEELFKGRGGVFQLGLPVLLALLALLCLRDLSVACGSSPQSVTVESVLGLSLVCILLTPL